MSEQIFAPFRGFDYNRTIANVVATISFVALVMLFFPEIVSFLIEKINFSKLEQFINWMAAPVLLICLCIFIGTTIRVSSYIVEEILGALFQNFTYKYYYNDIREWVENRYKEIYTDIDEIKSTETISTVDLVNSLKAFYAEYSPEQDKVVKRHFLTLELVRSTVGFSFCVIIYELYQAYFHRSIEERWLILALAIVLFLTLVRQFPRRIKKIVRNEYVLIESGGRKYQNFLETREG